MRLQWLSSAGALLLASACVVNETELPDGTSCAAGSVVTYKNGAWICEPGAGQPMLSTGLTTDGDAIAVDPTQVPLVDRTGCADGMVVARSSTAAGGWHCIAPPQGPRGSDGRNGTNGDDGTDGVGIGATSRPATTGECATGGIVAQTWRDLPPQDGMRNAATEPLTDMLPAICNGARGTDGEPGTTGAPGAPLRSRVTAVVPASCTTGGQTLEVWTDLDNDTMYDPATESLTQIPVCRGATGPTATLPARFFVHASIDVTGGSNVLPATDQPNPTPLSNGGNLVMTELPATSAGAAPRIPCATGNAPSAIQCGPVLEHVGVSFVIPSDGFYRVCVNYTFQMGAVAGQYRVFHLGLYETSETATSPMATPTNVQYFGSNSGSAYRQTPYRHCEVFNWTSAQPRKVVRLMYTSLGMSTDPNLGGNIELSRIVWEAERI